MANKNLIRLIFIALTLTATYVENIFGENICTENEGKENPSEVKFEVPQKHTKLEENLSHKISETLLIKLEEYMVLKLNEFEKKIEKLTSIMDLKFNESQKMFVNLEHHINSNYEKLENKMLDKIEEGNRKSSCNSNYTQTKKQPPEKPFINNDYHTYAIVKINNTVEAYNDVVKKRDFAEVSVSWNSSQSENPAETSRVTLSGVEVWSGKGDETAASFKVKNGGIYEIKVQLCNENGCSQSDANNIYVMDTDAGTYSLSIWNRMKEAIHTSLKEPSGKVVGAYYTEWHVYRTNYNINRCNSYQNLTHLLYRFISICGGDGINDSAKKIEGNFESLQSSCKGREDFMVSILDPKAALSSVFNTCARSRTNYYRGNFGHLILMKQAKPDLKILPSIGGPLMSDPFNFFTEKTKRDTFVASVKDFLQTWKFFDGVNIDWEYPKGNGTGLGISEHSRVYVQLMKELRDMLNELSVEIGKKYEVTSAINAASMQVVNFGEVQKYMDYIFLMSYNFKGVGSDTLLRQTSQHAPLSNPKEHYTTDDCIQSLLTQGVESKKIVIGVTNRGKARVSSLRMHYESFHRDYSKTKWDKYYDSIIESSDSKNSTEYIIYDDVNSTIAKGKFVRDNQLGGLFTWELDKDNEDILNAMNIGLENGK